MCAKRKTASGLGRMRASRIELAALASEMVARPHLVQAAVDLLASRGVLVLCAGPGMGKSSLAAQIATSETQMGRDVRMLRLGDGTADDELKRLTRFSRSLVVARGNGENVAAIVEDVPPLDEHDLRRFQRAVAKLVRAGCPLVITLRPEAAQALDDLGTAAAIMRAVRLRVSEAELPSWGVHVAWPQAFALTCGVPALVDALAKTDAESIAATVAGMGSPSIYDAELRRQIAASMRSSIMDDERRLRLLMLLLGRGRIEDLEDESGLAGELALDIAADEPFFGIDITRGSFSLAGWAHLASSPACREVLRELAADYQDVVESAVELLVLRDDFGRAGFACAMLSDPAQRARLVLPRAMRYLDAGHVGLVRDAAGYAEGDAQSHPELVARAALATLDGDEDACADLLARLPKPSSSLQQDQLALLDDLHRACLANRRAVHMSAPIGPAQDASSRFRRHVIIRALMVQGRFREAYDELLGARLGSGSRSLSETLLLADAECLDVLMGEGIGQDGGPDYAAAELLRRMGLEDLALYHLDFLAAFQALSSREAEVEGQERCLLRAEQRGDKLLLCAMGCIAAIMDMRRASYLRAHLRCLKAGRLAAEVGAPFLQMLAQIVDALSSKPLGEVVAPINVQAALPRGWQELAGVMGACVSDDEAALFQEAQRLPAAGPPVGAEVLLDLALHHLGSSSVALGVVLPATWRRAARLTPRAREEVHVERDDLAPSVDLLEVRLLGGFDVRLGGEQIPLAMWGRGSARALLAALCIAHGHKLSRAEAIEMLWPELDYMRGRNNVYSAVSSIRRTIGQTSTGPQYLLGKEELMLDMAYVRCDVDQLEELAVKVLAREGGDLAVMKCCEAIQALYRGDLDIPIAENSQPIVARRSELRELYVDCMVTGAECALELDSVQRAVWFARSARRVDPLREDATALLMRAFARQGRILDARAAYEGYANELLAKASVPPSRSMRELAREVGATRGGEDGDEPFELISAIC